MRVEVTSQYSGHLHKKEGWGTACVYGLPTTECHHCEELLPLTPDHRIAGPNPRNMLFHEARPVGHLQPSMHKGWR